MSHLLVTNDYPPKTGGIQSYLWELWRRLPPEGTTVLTASSAGHEAMADFDAAEPYRIVRSRMPVLLPTPLVRRRILGLAEEVGAKLVIIDPAFPLGLLGPTLGLPYGVILHGAEVTIPGRLPASRQLLSTVVAGADLVLAGGPYPEREALRAAHGRLGPVVRVPPGVDVDRFVPLAPAEREAARRRFGLDPAGRLLLSVSRLVPRKGMDVLIEATAALRSERPDLELAIAGSGRDRTRLEWLARKHGVAVRFLGRVPDADLPALYGCADVFAMLCRNRWGGLEQEGFGIVFLEAAATGVAQIAGYSGGAHDAVVDGETGLVVERPADPVAAARAIAKLLDDEELRRRLGQSARQRAVAEFDHRLLAARLESAIGGAGG